VTVVLVAWCVGAGAAALRALRIYLETGRVLSFLVAVCVVSLAIALLMVNKRGVALPLQLLVLIPSLFVFPFTFVAVWLLGYLTRPETVSYFKQRPDGPRWDTAETWRRGEGPWLVALGLTTGLFLLFLELLLAMLRAYPNL
jgi:hypothetical protein